MNRSIVAIVARKELLEIVRDKRTLYVLLLLPVLLYPLLGVGSVFVAAEQLRSLASRTYRVWVEDLSDCPPALLAHLERSVAEDEVDPSQLDLANIRLELALLPESADVDHALSTDQIDAVLRGGGDTEAALARGEVPALELLYNGGIDTSTFAMRRVALGVQRWKRDLTQARLVAADLSPTILDPVSSQVHDRGPPGAAMARALSGLLVMLALTGAFYPALDLGAGEKERGTLETLLLAPPLRVELAMGKFVAVSVVAGVCAVLHLASMGLTLTSASGYLPPRLALEVDPWLFPAMLLVLLPLVALFSALALAVSNFAASYKEGQAYLTPLVVVAIVPTMVAAFPGVRLTSALSLVPGVGAALLMKELLGQTAQLLHVGLVVLSSGAYAALAVRWVGGLYEREEVLWRPAQAAAPDLLGLNRPPLAPGERRTPDLPQALALAVLIVLLQWHVGTWLSGKGIVVGALGSLLGLVGVPAVLYAVWLKVDVRRTFRLRRPGGSAWVAAALLAVGVGVLNLEVAAQQRAGAPTPSAEEVEALKALATELSGLRLGVLLLLFAVLPAWVEEVVFRGFVLSGLRREGGPVAAVVVSALLFALAHLDPNRLLPTFAAGLVLGTLALRSGSLGPSILLHMLYNGGIVALGYAEWGGASDPPVWLWVVGGVSGGVGLWLLRRLGKT